MIKIEKTSFGTIPNVFFTSDTHYGHKNIVKGTTTWDMKDKTNKKTVRNFETVEDMNDRMVENINSIVSKNDFLIHVGDWSFGGLENIGNFRNRINCDNVILFIGNHDTNILKNKNYSRKNFTMVIEKFDVLEIAGIDEKFFICHYPMLSWGKSAKYMLYGHVHSTGKERFVTENSMDVGIGGSPQFRPYSMDEVIALLNRKKHFSFFR